MKLPYIALGIGATSLLIGGILAVVIMTSRNGEEKKLPPAPLTLSEDRLNRLEADILKLKSENIKLNEENEALRKESELLNKQLGDNPAIATLPTKTGPLELPPSSVVATDPLVPVTPERGQPGAPSSLPQTSPGPLGPDPTQTPDAGEPDRLTAAQQMVVRAPMLAKVIEFDKGWNVLTFDAGKNQNVSAGMRFSVRRDRFLVCSAKVVEVHANHAVAEIMEGTVPLGMEIKVGDHVVTYIANSLTSVERMGAYGVPSEQGVTNPEGKMLPAAPAELAPDALPEPPLPGNP